jgi:creatinine amidohydrolase
MLPKRDWMDMTWEDFAAGEPSRWIAVLPVAAVEQHGPHLPLGVDTFIADAYLRRTRELLPAELPAIFLPVQAIGQSDEHLAYPGTLTLSAETLARTLSEIGESVYRAGVRKLVFINSHGGNWQAIERAARELRVRLRMLPVIASWHRFGYPDDLFGDDERRHGIHAGDIETSIMLAGRPDTVHTARRQNFPSTTQTMENEFKWLRLARPAGFGWMTQDLNPAGAVGDATQATAAKGEAALAHGARAFVELLQDVDRFDLARLADGPLAEPI